MVRFGAGKSLVLSSNQGMPLLWRKGNPARSNVIKNALAKSTKDGEILFHFNNIHMYIHIQFGICLHGFTYVSQIQDCYIFPESSELQ
jgi:hypothetical protein